MQKVSLPSDFFSNKLWTDIHSMTDRKCLFDITVYIRYFPCFLRTQSILLKRSAWQRLTKKSDKSNFRSYIGYRKSTGKEVLSSDLL